MVWFQCDDCGDRVKTCQLPRHFRFCSATKFSCNDCGNMIEQDSVQSHNQCITEAEYLSKMPSWFCSLCNVNCIREKDYFKHVNGKKHREEELDEQKRQAGQPTVDKENSKQHPNIDLTIGLSNCDPWLCSLCDSKSTSQQSLLDHAYGRKHRANVEEYVNRQQWQSEPSIVDKKDNSKQQTEVDINVGLSSCYPWFCSLCNTKSTSQHSLLDHANGKKHRANVEAFGANREQRQLEPSIMDKDNSKQQTEVDRNVGLSNSYPWFCSLCNIKATCKQNLLAHADGWKHRANINYFAVEQQQQSEQSTVEKKDTIEKASNCNSEQKKIALPVPSSVGNEYSQVDKKRKLQTFDETWKGEVVQADEAKGGGERNSKPKKAKKQTELDSDFEKDREDIKLLLVSYSKEELVNLIYKTAEEGSQLISAILESADLDINQRNIFVRGFGWDTTQENLKVAFESYGDIEDCSVIMDKTTGRGKGYGFVLFKTRKGARKALSNPQKRMFNRTILCNLASEKPCKDEKPHDMVEPVKIDPTSTANQSEVVLPGLELAHGHMLQRREQQQTMEMFGQNMPFYRHSQLHGFDPMYGALRGSQMIAGPPNFSMFGSSMMNQGSMLPPPTHMGMAGQYFGDGEHTWYQR